MAAFDLALAAGCDGFEFDVRQASDGEAVICHDAKIGGREVSQTSSQELALPLLRDVLERYRDRAFLDIELKVAGLEKVTLNLLREHPPRRGYVISSFLPEVLAAMHSVDAGVPLGLICETKKQLATWTRIPVQYLVLHRELVQGDAIAELRTGVKIMVWTVNAALQMKQFASWGVQGIISDNPARLTNSLRPGTTSGE